MNSEDLIFRAVLLCVGGVYVFWQGWIRVRKPDGLSADLFEPITLALSRILQGEAKMLQVKTELRKPDKVRRTGYYSIAGGIGLFIAGCLNWLGLLIISAKK